MAKAIDVSSLENVTSVTARLAAFGSNISLSTRAARLLVESHTETTPTASPITTQHVGTVASLLPPAPSAPLPGGVLSSM
jgi:hypothetical protein